MPNPLGIADSQFETWSRHIYQTVSNLVKHAVTREEPIRVLNEKRIKELIVWTESQHEIQMIVDFVGKSERAGVVQVRYKIRVKGPTTKNKWLPVLNTVALATLLKEWRSDKTLNPNTLVVLGKVIPLRTIAK